MKVLVALAAILAVLVPPTTASASGLPAAETRVGAFTLAAPDVVGVHECITAGQHWVRGPSQLRLALGHCVAAEAGGSRFSQLSHASDGIAPYSVQSKVTAGHGGSIQAHHLIEKRFADVLGAPSTNDWAAVVVTRAEHQVFTNAWREAIPYGAGTRRATPDSVMSAARGIYAEYPEVLKALGLS